MSLKTFSYAADSAEEADFLLDRNEIAAHGGIEFFSVLSGWTRLKTISETQSVLKYIDKTQDVGATLQRCGTAWKLVLQMCTNERQVWCKARVHECLLQYRLKISN